jgi:regulator of RNase E activity RraA
VLNRASVGEWLVSRDDLVFVDDDGVLFVPADRIDEIFSPAQFIRDTEHQADQIRSGTTLREQLPFDEYLENATSNPNWACANISSLDGPIEV